jgi:hypothetical protein
MRKPIIAISTGLLIGTSIVGCKVIGFACTEMGCNGTVQVSLSESELEEGSYILDLAYGSVVTSCDFEVPFNSSTASCDQAEISLDGADVVVQAMTGMGETFESVEVTLSENDLVVHSEEKVVDSEPFFPNGEECDKDFGCLSASVHLAL